MVIAIGLRRGRRSAWQLATALLTSRPSVTSQGRRRRGGRDRRARRHVARAAPRGVHRPLPSAPRKAAIAVAAGLLTSIAALADARHPPPHRPELAAQRPRRPGADGRHPRRPPPLAPLPPRRRAAGRRPSQRSSSSPGWRSAPTGLQPTTPRPPSGPGRSSGATASGTLDYFALRDDKRHFVVQDTVVAYTVANGTAVVSPDPIGPADQRTRGVVGVPRRRRRPTAGASPRSARRSRGCRSTRPAGMTSMYIGDEAVVDVTDVPPRRRPAQVTAPGRQPCRRGRLHRRVLDSADRCPPQLADELRSACRRRAAEARPNGATR